MQDWQYVRVTAAQIAALTPGDIPLLDKYGQWRDIAPDKATIVSLFASLAIAEKIPGVQVQSLALYSMFLTNVKPEYDLPTTLPLLNEPKVRQVLVRNDSVSVQGAAYEAVDGGWMKAPGVPPRDWRTIDETPEGLFRGNPDTHNPAIERGIMRPMERG